MCLRTVHTFFALAVGLGVCVPASAQQLAVADDVNLVPEVTRDAVDIRAVLMPRPELDTVDTALVFTNPRDTATLVVCAGRDAQGRGVGRARTKVPAHGVRLLFASDLSAGRDYVGSATCKARSRVIPSAFVVGVQLSDAPATVNHGWQDSQINFPIVATF